MSPTTYLGCIQLCMPFIFLFSSIGLVKGRITMTSLVSFVMHQVNKFNVGHAIDVLGLLLPSTHSWSGRRVERQGEVITKT